jgi:uncharacterized protein YjbI with pentapeptide repeats/glucose/arabinose dehydrogenase
MDKEPVLVVPVAQAAEGGLLGIATTSNHVFLYFTEPSPTQEKNTVYQYDWDGNNLTNPILIKKLSADSKHNGGVFAKGQNKEIYFIIGDDDKDTIFQNIPSAPSSNETGSIFKIYTDDNNHVELFAVGIRNSFGLAVDPITGHLWETENGTHVFDEINLVKNRFNSGWKSIMGPADRDFFDGGTKFVHPSKILDASWIKPQSLEGFVYSDPEFSWHTTVGVTAIAFPDMNNFGKYKDWLFVGDFNNGRIYKFQLNSDRTEFIFSTPNLKDLVYDNDDELNEILFAETFSGGITDIKFGHDAMYVVSHYDGSIYKIYPRQSIPPLNQYQIGTSHKEIVCKSGLMPIMKNSGFIACVYPKTAYTIINEAGWSINHPEMPKIDFKHQYLDGLNFEHLNLKNSDFKGAIFNTAKIINVNFANANLSNSILTNKDLTGTILNGADLTDANLTGVDLSGKDLTGTILSGVDLSGKDLTGTILSGVDLSGKDLTGTVLKGADLSGKDLTGTILRGADLTDVILTGVNLSGKDLTGTILSGVDLSGKDLTGTVLNGVDLTDANLTGVDLSGKDLTGTILSGVDLSGRT